MVKILCQPKKNVINAGQDVVGNVLQYALEVMNLMVLTAIKNNHIDLEI